MSTFDHDYCNFDEAISVPNNQPMEIKKKVSRGRQCVSYGCLNYQYSIVDGQRVKSNRSFYCFPSDPNSKDEWCRSVIKSSYSCVALYLSSSLILGYHI